MNPTRLSHAILAAANSKTVKALAFECGLSPSTLSKLVSTRRRVDAETLHALCTRTAPTIGLKLLLAHLHDEVERGGRDETEVIISPRESDQGDDLELIADELRRERVRGSDDLRAVIKDLAQMVRGYRRRLANEYPIHQDEHLSLVAEHPPTELVATVETNSERRVTSINSDFTALCGYTLEEVRGRNLSSILQGEKTEPAVVKKIRTALKARKPVTVELTNYHKDGHAYRAQVSIAPTPTGFHGEARPIT